MKTRVVNLKTRVNCIGITGIKLRYVYVNVKPHAKCHVVDAYTSDQLDFIAKCFTFLTLEKTTRLTTISSQNIKQT